MRGWTGGGDGTKVMMFEVDMPHCGEETCNWNRPAVWALNARVSCVSLRLHWGSSMRVQREFFTDREMGSIPMATGDRQQAACDALSLLRPTQVII